MIHTCPHCGRTVANDERLVRDRVGRWIPTICAAGDGPLCVGGEIVTNHPHWYVTVIDPDNPRQRGVLLGPFPDYDAARANVNRARSLAEKVNWRSVFYAFGVSSSVDRMPGMFAMEVSANDQARRSDVP